MSASEPARVEAPASGPAERSDVPWRFALGVLAAYVVVGALSGVVWEWLWTPPGQLVHALSDVLDTGGRPR